MAWEVDGDLTEFGSAVAWFRKLVPVTDAQWAAMGEAARRQAFRVAGAAQADLITEVWNAVDSALVEGTTFADFQAEVGDKLASAWGGEDANRLDTVFRTNIQNAYGAGRYYEQHDPDVKAQRTYLQFSATLDHRVTDTCRALHGTIRPIDDPFWMTRQPPLHFRCRSTTISLTEEEARELGVTETPPTANAMAGFGLPPDQFAATWTPDVTKYPAPIAAQLAAE
jgi:SPP1 gp7 family putative phage head morphogenesis protein